MSLLNFAPEAKSRGGILVVRAYIKESNYSYNMQLVYQKKISICLNRDRKESLGNDDVLDLNNAERSQVTKGLEKKTTFEV